MKPEKIHLKIKSRYNYGFIHYVCRKQYFLAFIPYWKRISDFGNFDYCKLWMDQYPESYKRDILARIANKIADFNNKNRIIETKQVDSVNGLSLCEQPKPKQLIDLTEKVNKRKKEKVVKSYSDIEEKISKGEIPPLPESLKPPKPPPLLIQRRSP